MNCLNQAKVKKKIGYIPKTIATIIKLLEKKDKGKRLIRNWRSISLNVGYKIIWKIFASRLKKVLPNLISSQQTALLHTKLDYRIRKANL